MLGFFLQSKSKLHTWGGGGEVSCVSLAFSTFLWRCRSISHKTQQYLVAKVLLHLVIRDSRKWFNLASPDDTVWYGVIKGKTVISEHKQTKKKQLNFIFLFFLHSSYLTKIYFLYFSLHKRIKPIVFSVLLTLLRVWGIIKMSVSLWQLVQSDVPAEIPGVAALLPCCMSKPGAEVCYLCLTCTHFYPVTTLLQEQTLNKKVICVYLFLLFCW